MRQRTLLLLLAAGFTGMFGCGHNPPPVAMAPPVGSPSAPPMGEQVYPWQETPQGQQIPVTRARFDQGGYQIYCASGETIVVPFANQNLYVLQFGRSETGQSYFVNAGNAPVLYLRRGDFLENAAAQNARWYPIPDDYAYTRPMYVSIAPSWNDYVGMGWYPGMTMYGGMWGYTPRASFAWMPGFSVNIGGNYYRDYVSYRTYYTSNPGYTRNRVVYNNYNTRSTGSFGARQASGSTGSFGSGRSTRSFGSGFGSTGSFGSGRSSGAGRVSSSSGSFGGSGFARPSSPSSSFGRSSGGSFGSSSGSSVGRSSTSSGSFGRSSSSSGSFGGTRSFGSSGSFGSGRSSSSSFGGSRSSSNGGRR